jgi:hypothetical protein
MSLSPMQRTGTADTTAVQRPAPTAAPAAPAAQGLKPLPQTARDRFVRGMGEGALGGTKSAMFMAVPIAAMVVDGSLHLAPKALKAAIPFGTSAASIATMTLVLAGTGALVGGATAAVTRDKVWAPTMGAATGGVLLGAVRGLQTRSWQGLAAGALIGGFTGFLAGRQVAKSAPDKP